MNININFGNFWDALSAIGTTSAVVVSLWLAKREEKNIFSVKMSLATGINRDNSIADPIFLTIDAFNKSKYSLTIEEVGFVRRKNGDKLVITNSKDFIEGSSGLNFKTDPKGAAIYILERDYIREEVHKKWGDKVKIRAYVRDSSEKKHYSKRYPM